MISIAKHGEFMWLKLLLESTDNFYQTKNNGKSRIPSNLRSQRERFVFPSLRHVLRLPIFQQNTNISMLNNFRKLLTLSLQNEIYEAS